MSTGGAGVNVPVLCRSSTFNGSVLNPAARETIARNVAISRLKDSILHDSNENAVSPHWLVEMSTLDAEIDTSPTRINSPLICIVSLSMSAPGAYAANYPTQE